MELLRPSKTCREGRRPNKLAKSLEKRLTWMEYFLWAYIDSSAWTTAANKTATFIRGNIHIKETEGMVNGIYPGSRELTTEQI